MKVTSNWVLLHFPFLSTLLEQGRVDGRKKLILKIETDTIRIMPPFHEAVSRFTSSGEINGQSFTHFAGSDASMANNPTELVPDGSPLEGRPIQPGCYYAVLDIFTANGFRELTVFFNTDDLRKSSQELRNQLTELHLKLATTPP